MPWIMASTGATAFAQASVSGTSCGLVPGSMTGTVTGAEVPPAVGVMAAAGATVGRAVSPIVVATAATPRLRSTRLGTGTVTDIGLVGGVILTGPFLQLPRGNLQREQPLTLAVIVFTSGGLRELGLWAQFPYFPPVAKLRPLPGHLTKRLWHPDFHMLQQLQRLSSSCVYYVKSRTVV